MLSRCATAGARAPCGVHPRQSCNFDADGRHMAWRGGFRIFWRFQNVLAQFQNVLGLGAILPSYARFAHHTENTRNCFTFVTCTTHPPTPGPVSCVWHGTTPV